MRQVRADGFSDDQPIRLYATATTGPIGSVVWNYSSRGAFVVDGRQRRSDYTLWGGEIIESPADAGLQIHIDSIGQITLGRGSALRVAASQYGERALVASLFKGAAKIDLDREAGAHLQAAGSTFTALSGASFHVELRSGEAALKTFSGTVVEQQPAQRRYLVRPVGLGSNISVRARATRQIQIQVTDENDRPVPDLPVIFTVGGSGGVPVGTFAGAATLTVRTNAQGLASAPFTAGDQAGNGSITANVEGTRDSWTGSITVTAAAGFWTARNSSIIAGIGAAIAIGVAVAARDDKNLRPLPPPDVKP